VVVVAADCSCMRAVVCALGGLRLASGLIAPTAVSLRKMRRAAAAATAATTATTATKEEEEATKRGMEALASRASSSWVAQLTEDPEGAANAPNRASRQVRSGHYVLVDPTPLPAPELLLFSEELLQDMGLDATVTEDPRFARFFSGDKSAFSLGASWATPYALSIMGEQLSHNCPFGNGNGYGDGRAISIGEVVSEEGKRFEMQLKGGGKTPFCRGADGRAVLRSSLREFLASEAMHFLGVPTTRALSLVKSNQETVRRPWYSAAGEESPAFVTEDDPRLAHFPPAMRKQLAAQLNSRAKGSEPDVAILESAAITTRVAPSFLRVGHVDLFARRAVTSNESLDQLKQILTHAMFREDPDLWKEEFVDDAEFKAACLEFATRVGSRLASLAAEWLRVGFAQGNFNADNCLVGGRTMDYGPFGFIDKYDPEFAKWVGSGAHFAFAAQPNAARANFATLVKSLVPLFQDDPAPLQKLVEDASPFQDAVHDCFRRKLGFLEVSDASKAAWNGLEPLLRRYELDYTIFFRELSEHPFTVAADDLISASSYSLKEDDSSALASWLATWRANVSSQNDGDDLSQRMSAANPKYILREWMLVDAYTAASRGDMGPAKELHALVKRPYDDHGPDLNLKYYKKADATHLSRPGTAFMT